MDYRQMTAPCGLDCFNCLLYLAGEDGKLKEALAQYMNLPYKQAVCRGCRPEKGAPAAEGFTETC